MEETPSSALRPRWLLRSNSIAILTLHRGLGNGKTGWLVAHASLTYLDKHIGRSLVWHNSRCTFCVSIRGCKTAAGKLVTSTPAMPPNQEKVG